MDSLGLALARAFSTGLKQGQQLIHTVEISMQIYLCLMMLVHFKISCVLFPSSNSGLPFYTAIKL